MTPPAIVGIDLGKNWFHVVGLDEGGATILRKRLNRAQLAEYAVTAPRCIVATESCPGSQYWGRVFTAAGHEVRILPAQFVKPYLKGNTNDFNDAAAIAEAGGRASMRYVPLKTMEQLELQALPRVRRRFIVERTAVINQMRALLLEHGRVIPVGRAAFVRRLPTIFTDAEHRLSPRLVELLHRLRHRWLALDVEIVQATRDLAEWADQSPLCRRAATIPGIGPIIATAVVAAVGDGHMFARGRDMAAWLGLGPRQHSTGGKPTLGSISKRGNTYLRELFIQGAQSSFVYLKRDQSSLGPWWRQVETRRQRQVAIVALANKMVRICWKVLTSEEDFRAYPPRVASAACRRIARSTLL
jgi:transposase